MHPHLRERYLGFLFDGSSCYAYLLNTSGHWMRPGNWGNPSQQSLGLLYSVCTTEIFDTFFQIINALCKHVELFRSVFKRESLLRFL